MNLPGVLIALSMVVLSWTADPREQARAIEALIDADALERARAELDAEALPPLLDTTLRGRLALAEGQPGEAIKAFARAIELAPDHAPLQVLLAHAQLEAGRHDDALATMSSAKLDASDPPIALLLAAAHRAANDPASAYAALRRAARAHPEHAALVQQLVVLCASEGLFEAAKQWAQRIDRATLGATTAAVAIQQARGKTGGLRFARWMAAAFVANADVWAELGWVESAADEYRRAGQALEKAANLGADTAFAAAEHFRAARRYREALAANAAVTDEQRRAEQRFDILFEDGKHARSIVAGDRLETKGWLEPRRRYNLAYAHYALRQFAEASRHARALSGTDESARAAALLRAMGR